MKYFTQWFNKMALSVCLLSGLSAHAQNTKEWSLSALYQHTRLLAQNTSPLIYVANTGGLGGQYNWGKKKNITHTLSLQLAVGSNQSKRWGKRDAILYDPYNLNGDRDSVTFELNPGLSFVTGTLSYSWAYHWEKFALQTQLSNQYYYGAMGADVWFFNNLSVNLAPTYTLLEKENKKLKVFAQFNLLSYLVRQPYTLDPSLPQDSYLMMNLKTGSLLTSLHRFQNVQLGISYEHTFKGGKKWGVNYNFNFLHLNNYPNRQLNLYSNQLSLVYFL